MNVRAAVVVLLALSAGAVRAQQPAPAGPPSSVASPPSAPLPALTERLNVIVEGADGRLVSGLRASDFILRVDGQPQRIENVAGRAPAPRVIALLFDEFHVRADATAAVREAVHRFVEQQLRPDDRVVILKPLDSLPEIHLTADRERLHAAIDSFEGRKGNYEPRTPLEEALAEAARAQIVLSGLRALASRLGTQPGRAGIVLVSEGFVRDARLTNARALPDVSVVERFANRFDVPVFAIDPAPAALDDPAEATLARLANQTGAFLDHGPDLGAAMQRAAAGLDAGYVITFAPPHGADGRFHTVTVDTTRKKGTARTRAGYIAPQPPNAYRAIARDTAEPFTTRLQHRSRFIDVWSGVTRFANAEGQIVVTWEPASLFGTFASTAVLMR